MLEKPPFIYFDGRVRPWAAAMIHVWSEVAIRGASVFEGVRGYRQPDGSLGLVFLDKHIVRLLSSARALRFPHLFLADQIKHACVELASCVATQGEDVYIRPTLYIAEGRYGSTLDETRVELFVTAFPQARQEPTSLRLGVSTWRRSGDTAMPARVKSGANYQTARLAIIEARAHGYDDMLLLNDAGRVAEATGSCAVVVRDGVVSTPLAQEGALESITVNAMGGLCDLLGIPFVRRSIDRTELLVADEVGLCGTAVEITPAESIDGLTIEGRSRILRQLWTRYREAVAGMMPLPFITVDVI